MSYIDPDRQAWEIFKSLPRNTPIQMLNLVKVRSVADYPADHPNHDKGLTGLDAYRASGRTTADIFARVGGRQMPLLDFYGDFRRANQSCGKCGWSGPGSAMASGDSFGDGIDMHCPKCSECWGFVQWSVAVADDPPIDWKANVGRVAD